MRIKRQEIIKIEHRCLLLLNSVYTDFEQFANYVIFSLFLKKDRKSMVKLLIELGCCISFSDSTRTEILCNNRGQTALYWIVTKMPDIVSA
jgi:hypothetical protein